MSKKIVFLHTESNTMSKYLGPMYVLHALTILVMIATAILAWIEIHPVVAIVYGTFFSYAYYQIVIKKP